MLEIKSIPAFRDNYIWLIQNREKRCIVVDPGDAKPVLEYLLSHNLSLDAILLTHHHADHTGGITELKRAFPNLNVIGPLNDPILGLTHSVDEGDKITLFEHEFTVLAVPGHTHGHIAYLGDNKLFCGDVLFSAGCGRVFEGTYQEMHDSLQKLASLDDATQIYCAHEYTAANIAFALAVEPENHHLQAYRDEVNRLTANRHPTLPTTIGLEKRINPFLRTTESDVIKSVTNITQDVDSLSVFSALRDWKDEF